MRTADRIVLPGVGAYADCRAGPRAVPGMVEAVEDVVVAKARPFLGICVGMQLMSERGLEKTVTRGFGWIAGDVKEIEPADPALKIPQIGWNTIELKREHPLFAGIPHRAGRAARLFRAFLSSGSGHADEVLAVADYGGPVTAAVARDNVAGTQFHPEKSQALGLALIANFLRWKPMILFPAIDLKDGQCVRLKLGDMGQATVYNADPAAQAKAFEDQGFEWLHVVDLNGAFAGQSVNGAAVEAILKATKNPVQLGGGIRTLADIENWLDKGLARVILGTVAVRDPDLVKQACRLFPGKIAVGIDARGGKVAVEGWAEASTLGVDRAGEEIRRRRRRRHHLHRHRPRRRAGRHQLGSDDRACRRGLDPGDRLGRARLDRRHRAHDHARRKKARRRDLRPRAL